MTRVRPSLILALVVVLLAATLTLLDLWRDDRAVAGPGSPSIGGTVPVSSSTLVCPDVSALGAGSTTEVTVVSPTSDVLAAGEGTVGDGAGGATGSEATARPLGVDAPALVTVDEHGPEVTASVDDEEVGPAVVRTVGDLAPGLTATQVTTAAEGDVTGLAAASCLEPGTEFWFVGLGTELGHRPRLTVVNVEPTVAELDVFLYGPTGLLDLAALRDLAVPSGGTTTLELDSLAPDLSALAVEVRVRTGRVGAGVSDSYVDGLTSLGLDWVPTTAPGTRVVLPVAGGSGPRLLQLLAPGDVDTRVSVRLFTVSGAIVPVGLEEIELTAGVVRSIDLADVLDSAVIGLELSGEVPVAAGVRVVGGGDDRRDMAYAAAAVPLTGPAVLTGVRAGDGWSGRLSLSADDGGATEAATGGTAEPSPSVSANASASASAPPTTAPTEAPAAQAPARVLVSYLDGATGDPLGDAEIEVVPGFTLELPLTLADVEMPDRFSVVVTPLDGAVYGSWRLDRTGGADAGFTILSLASASLEVAVPFVRHDLSTGLRTS